MSRMDVVQSQGLSRARLMGNARSVADGNVSNKCTGNSKPKAHEPKAGFACLSKRKKKKEKRKKKKEKRKKKAEHKKVLCFGVLEAVAVAVAHKRQRRLPLFWRR